MFNIQVFKTREKMTRLLILISLIEPLHESAAGPTLGHILYLQDHASMPPLPLPLEESLTGM